MQLEVGGAESILDRNSSCLYKITPLYNGMCIFLPLALGFVYQAARFLCRKPSAWSRSISYSVTVKGTIGMTSKPSCGPVCLSRHWTVGQEKVSVADVNPEVRKSQSGQARCFILLAPYVRIMRGGDPQASLMSGSSVFWVFHWLGRKERVPSDHQKGYAGDSGTSINFHLEWRL